VSTEESLGPVIVTGAASGLGEAVGHALAALGHPVLGLDRRPARGLDAIEVDLADGAAAEQAVREGVEKLGGLWGLVTAAGTDACGALGEVPRDDWERVVRVNLLGTAAVVRAALPHLERARGRIVTVASTLGLRAVDHATAYCASKFGVIGFTRALARELAGRVGVTLLVPGGMRTHFFDGRDPRYQPGPDADLADPADVAQVVVASLRGPATCLVRELVVCPATEPSWP
jgi:NAD(P)-dependent dehydrogenase (short-subunit alcohol dehydrogenase family)